MGFVHAALCTFAVLALFVTLVSSRPHIKFETSKSLSSTYGPLKQISSQHHSLTPVTKLPTPPIIPPPTVSPNASSGSSNGTTKIEVCIDCIEFMQNNLQTLIAIVTKIGVTDTCDKICSMLNNSVEVDACNVMCDGIGSERFWQLFVSAGINPIYACEMVNACVAGTFPAVSFTAANISPASGTPGTSFEFTVQFTVINETGVGESAFVIYYPNNADHELGFISQKVFADYEPGSYEASLSFPTNASFSAGKYLVMFDLCSGACGQDPDPYPFATEEFSFNITAS